MSKIYQDNLAFIQTIQARFPDKPIIKNFEEFLAFAPMDRPELAKQKLDILPRTGYVRRGVPADYVETVGLHVAEMKEMAWDMVRFEPKIFEDNDYLALIEMLDVHDGGETIIGDFTPSDDISKADKKHLEHIAVMIIYEEFPEQLKAGERFEAGADPLSKIGNDIDKLQMFKKSKFYVKTFPTLAPKFQNIFDSVDERQWTNNAVGSYYQSLKNA